MPVYVYSCCGTQPQLMDERDTCPECGSGDQRDFMATVNPSYDQRHGRVESIKGVRNYYDENMEVFIRDPKHKAEEMERRGLVMHPNKSSTYESYSDKKFTHDQIGRDGFVKPEHR